MKIIASVVTVVVSLVFAAILIVYLTLNATLNYQAPLTFEVKQGQSFNSALSEVAGKTENFPIKLAKIYLKVKGLDRDLKVGDYEITKGYSALQVINIMTKGQLIEKQITLQEGLNLFQIADLLEYHGLCNKEEFIAAVQEQSLIVELLGIQLPSLEGYLFPDTYRLPKSWTAKQYVKTFVDNFKKNWKKIEGGNKMGMTRHQTVILASIVEKETGDPSERPMISSVFHNRLKKNMRLQSDPTTMYGVWVKTGSTLANITKKDLRTPTPYNTYTVNGLPVGPIANPGKAALIAAMNPLESRNLYFVSRNDGTHKFSRSYEEHLQAVRKFQLDPKAREGKSWRDLNKNKTTVVR